MYRIGCTMTGGSSGGGWFRMVDGKTVLVSNTSIGPTDNTWLAGPQLGQGAKTALRQHEQEVRRQSAPCARRRNGVAASAPRRRRRPALLGGGAFAVSSTGVERDRRATAQSGRRRQRERRQLRRQFLVHPQP